jgi:Flp pilus assembly protein TadD
MRAPTLSYGGGASAYRYALTQTWAWVHYLRLFFVPVGLSADTDLAPFERWWDSRVIVGLLVIAALAAVVWRTARHPRRWPISFGVAWFMISLLPASSVLPLAEVVNEHRPFLAYMGLALAVVWAGWLALDAALDRWSPTAAVRTALPALVCGLLLGAHAVGVHLRNRVWQTPESLWADVTEKSPGNGRAWMNYGVALMARGTADPARRAFLRAQQLTPTYPFVEVNLGVLEGWVGDGIAAERHFRRALELGPADPTSYEFYASWLVKQGRAPEAIPLLETAVRLAPGGAQPRARLMELHAARGDGAATAVVARELLALEPANARARALASGAPADAASGRDGPAWVKLGTEAGAKGELVESALAYRAALALEPERYDALNNLGWTLGKLGFFGEAIPVLERAVRAGKDQDAALAQGNLEWVRRNVR